MCHVYQAHMAAVDGEVLDPRLITLPLEGASNRPERQAPEQRSGYYDHVGDGRGSSPTDARPDLVGNPCSGRCRQAPPRPRAAGCRAAAIQLADGSPRTPASPCRTTENRRRACPDGWRIGRAAAPGRSRRWRARVVTHLEHLQRRFACRSRRAPVQETADRNPDARPSRSVRPSGAARDGGRLLDARAIRGAPAGHAGTERHRHVS